VFWYDILHRPLASVSLLWFCVCIDGWVYTNDVWDDSKPVPYSGAVMRRRRWVRRVWFDGSAEGGRIVR
jgi:hypothetical protein